MQIGYFTSLPITRQARAVERLVGLTLKEERNQSWHLDVGALHQFHKSI